MAADIFISYSQRRRPLTEILANELQERGYSVWWDRELTGGQRFDDEIRNQLMAAKAVVVVWTPEAAASPYVRMEAGIGYAFGTLIPTRAPEFAVADIPVPFAGLETVVVSDIDRILAALIGKKVHPMPLRERVLQALDKTDPGVAQLLKDWEPALKASGFFIKEFPSPSLTVCTDIGKASGIINLATISKEGRVYLSDYASQNIARQNPEATKGYLSGVANSVLINGIVGNNAAGLPTNVKVDGSFPSLRALLQRKDDWLKLMVTLRDELRSASMTKA